MKIAYLANLRFPSERAHSAQIAHMSQAFAEQGADLHLFVNKRFVAGPESTVSLLGFNPKFLIYNIPPKFFFPKIKIFFYISEFYFTIAFLFKSKYSHFDIIFSRSEWIIFALSFFVKRNKLVWESHEAKFNFPAKFILSRNVKTVVISNGIYEDYLNFNIPKEQLCIAYDGIDDSFFDGVVSRAEAREKLNLPSDLTTIMYIGGFDGWKGVDTFFKASELCPDLNFVAIGGRREQIVQLQDDYPKVNFLGQLPYKDLKNNQQAADVLIVPNSDKTELSARYTSPLKLFAHMASNVPMIISDIPSLTTVIGGKHATLFKSDDFHSLAKSINEVLNEYGHKKIMAGKLYDESRQYTWVNRAKRILNFLMYTNDQ